MKEKKLNLNAVISNLMTQNLNNNLQREVNGLRALSNQSQNYIRILERNINFLNTIGYNNRLKRSHQPQEPLARRPARRRSVNT